MSTRDKTIFDELRARGNEFFNRMSSELMSNPNFTRAMQAAWWTKEKADQAVAQALRSMRIPTREEFERALRRIEQLETEVDRLSLAQRATAASPRGAKRSTSPAARAKTRTARARRPAAAGGSSGPAED
jgi:hypothetical protein